ncbi:MAG: phosphoenolpyruvate-utilizing N-terminal domain-containing protein, partial [Actinomycetes bacterium]
MSRKFTGIGVCPGVASAPVYKIETNETNHDQEVSWQEIAEALNKSAEYLEDKAKKIELKVAKEVLEAQSLMARDPDLLEKIKESMGDSKKSARNTLDTTLEDFKNNLLSLGDYFAERVADLDEIKKLTLNNLFGIEEFDLKI